MTVNSKLLEILVCPVSKSSLTYMREEDELWCAVSQLAYPVEDGIPVMLKEEARALSSSEVERLKS